MVYYERSDVPSMQTGDILSLSAVRNDVMHPVRLGFFLTSNEGKESVLWCCTGLTPVQQTREQPTELINIDWKLLCKYPIERNEID